MKTKESQAEQLARARKSIKKKRGLKEGQPKFKVTQTMRDTIQEVWSSLQVGTNAAGIETNLYFIASEDPKWFYEWCKPMLPKTLFVEGEVNNTFTGMTIEQLIDIATTGSAESGDEKSEG